ISLLVSRQILIKGLKVTNVLYFLVKLTDVNHSLISAHTNGEPLQRSSKEMCPLLSQFVSPYTGSIYGRHITGLCNKKQKEITKAIKRAHVFGFMPVMFKNPQFLTDPKLCNIKYPE
uniref:Small ribosomal subunit protein bS18m n=1 Tax=Geospiza parvula TaxID=87175 RepID=A0A8C3MA77_GEOPR